MQPRSNGGLGILTTLLSAVLTSPGILRTTLLRRAAGIRIDSDGVQVSPDQLHSHRKLIDRLIGQGHTVVVKNGTGRPVTIFRLTNLDPFPPADEDDPHEYDVTTPVPESSWLD